MSRIGKSLKIPFTITCADATAMIVAFGLKDNQTIVETFYYGITPATAKAAIDTAFTVDWDEIAMTLMTKAGNDFTGTMSETCTANAESDMLVMDIKAWNATENLVKRYEIKVLGDTFVKNVTNA